MSALQKRAHRLETVSNHWQKQGRDTAQFNEELKRVNRTLERQRKIRKSLRRQEQISARRDRFRGQLLDAAGLGAAVAFPIKAAADFQQAMARVGAVARASDEDLGKLSKTARHLGATTNWSAKEAAEGMQFLAMAGFDTQQTMKAMPGMLNLASAAGTSLGRTADIASDILSAFELDAEAMSRVGDVLTNTFTSSNTNLEMLGDTMKYVAPVAAKMGVSLEDTAAMAGLLGNRGIKASQAGTSMKTMMARLAAPAKEARGVLNSLGVSVKDANGNMRHMPTILGDLHGKMAGFGDVAKAKIVKTLFGLESMAAATILLAEAGKGNIQAYSEKLKESGTAAKVAEKQNNTFWGRMKQLGSAASELAIIVGDALLPGITVLTEMLTSATSVVGSLANDFPTLTSAIVIGTAAIIALKVAAIAGGYAFTFLQGVWVTATGVATALSGGLTVVATGIRAIGLAMAANPIGIAIAGIALAAGLIVTHWEPIKTFFLDLWDTIDEYFIAAWDGFVTLLSFTPIGILAKHWEPIVGFFSGLWGRATAPIGDAWGFTLKVLSWTPLGLVVSNWQPIAEFFTGLWAGITKSASEAFDWIAGKIEWAGNAVGKLKSIFGSDDEGAAEKIVSTPAAANTIANIAPSRPPAAANTNNVTYANQITINTRPDQSTQDIVDEIERRQKEREAASMFDAAPAYAYR